jgi:hypothetical protein
VNRGVAAARERRARLVERAAAERDELAAIAVEWQGALELVDRGRQVVETARRVRPALSWAAGVGMAALAFVQPTSLVGWVSRAAELWEAFRGRRPEAPASVRPPDVLG